MVFLGADEKDAAATHIGFISNQRRTYEQYVCDPFVLSFAPSLFPSTHILFLLHLRMVLMHQ